MDPILEDELKRSRRMKQYQHYQDHLDQLSRADKKDKSEPIGDLHGKKVKIITPEDSKTEIIFKRNIKKTS